ncbi:hypothetical protein KK010_23005 [Enterobacter mori]|nr:hypothetical protein [Enterobacter mori]MBT1872793.1 hypothetical protein [Enterobacter mori]HCM9655490.1 hypothetical protein [Enterobacter kobei]
MKYSAILILCAFLIGCAQKVVIAPYVSGKVEPVNSPQIIQELSNE